MSLAELKDKTVNVVTTDGRNIIGLLRAYDQVQNLVLQNSYERVFSDITGVLQQPLGLYIIRGDTIAIIGELDEEKDASIDFESIKAAPLKPIVH